MLIEYVMPGEAQPSHFAKSHWEADEIRRGGPLWMTTPLQVFAMPLDSAFCWYYQYSREIKSVF